LRRLGRGGLTEEENSEPHFLDYAGDFSDRIFGFSCYEDDGFGAGVSVSCVDDGGEDTEEASTWSSLQRFRLAQVERYTYI
jgi:hypothetical protein